MRQLVHVLYVTEEDVELHLKGEALEAQKKGSVVAHIPLHTLEGIVSFSYVPATPALMTACAERQIAFTVLSHQGKLRYRVEGSIRGNPELRLRQFQKFSQEDRSLDLAKIIISAKIHNSRVLIAKHLQNHLENAGPLKGVMKDAYLL